MHLCIRIGLLAISELVAESLAAAPAVVNGNSETMLRDAIFAANIGGDTAINITAGLALTQSLPMITSSVTATGNGFTLDAANQGRAFFVASGAVAISNLTVANARAQGEAGGASDGGGNACAGSGGVRISW